MMPVHDSGASISAISVATDRAVGMLHAISPFRTLT
jgi:hypothetical protein